MFIERDLRRDDDNVQLGIQSLRKKFSSLIRNLIKQLESEKTPVSDVHETLVWKIPQRLKKIYDKVRTEMYCRLEECKTLREFFAVLDSNWTFIDFDLLECIINEHGNDKLKSDMKIYIAKLREFCESTTVYKLIKFWEPIYSPSDIPKGFIVKLDRSARSCTVQELESLRRDTSHSISDAPLSVAAMILYEIKDGSVIVVWIIAGEVVNLLSESITQLITIKHSEFINKHKIIYLVLDGFILYPYNTSTIQQVR